MDGALALAAAGVAAAVVPRSVVAPSGPLRAISFRGAALKRTIGLASRQDRPFTPAGQAFVDALGGYVTATVSGERGAAVGPSDPAAAR